MKKLWLLNDLYVEEEYRQKGISIALIDKAKELCRETGACQLSLETSKTNMVGNNLYPKTGFQLDTEANFIIGCHRTNHKSNKSFLVKLLFLLRCIKHKKVRNNLTFL